MYADDLLVLSPSPEGLPKSINIIKEHAEEWKEEWKLKVNTKKSNIIIFSGNGQTKNNENFQYGSETKVKCDHRSKFSNLSNWKEEA